MTLVKLLNKLFTQNKGTFAEKVIQDVHEFVCSSEQIWRNVALHLLLTNGSVMQGMGAVRMRVQTADKNTIIHK